MHTDFAIFPLKRMQAVCKQNMIQLGNVDRTILAASTETWFANPNKSYFHFILR